MGGEGGWWWAVEVVDGGEGRWWIVEVGYNDS